MSDGYIRWYCSRCRLEVTTDYSRRTFKLCPNCGGGMIIKKFEKPDNREKII